MSTTKPHPVQRPRSGSRWSNWAGNQSSEPRRVVVPGSAGELGAAVREAAEAGQPVKAVGSGHSFTAVALTDGVQVRLDRMAGLRRLDREAGTVTVGAGMPLRTLNQLLAAEGLSLTNMGDIMVQTAAGAVSTGTHGTGRDSGSIAAQLRGMELVLADGTVRRCGPDGDEEERELFAAARVGLGALGIATELTFAVEPMFLLEAREEPMALDEVLDRFGELVSDNEHFEFYWFPHTDRTNTKRNNRTEGPRNPVGRISGFLDDEVLSNGVFEVANRLGRLVPSTIPSIAQLSSRALSARSYTDEAYRVFTSPRRVRFVEMEYALPREAAVEALREVRAAVEGSGWRISFPVEVRVAPADDIPLSTASGRDSAYIAVHMYRGTPFREYFEAVEQIMVGHGGRPHWGKLHSRDAEYLAAAYPRFGEFTALRDRLDPDRRFGNAYLRRVLGS
ncbi:FAD-linked oxidoreductase [Mangrovactinospora gilvigrisea]|uniref:FAD-linked oxidoreductase n=1 Tax=Mangrovactinospora gilvigrisea TaxID=1428644 RepID=A0A1J7C3Q9_9ACTN|nr:D-arabinono-1,4-lactone oxidase [Mangrovactinospora gilvigrisea]OIV36196.1 FAD-linked oxidoreductase [Mangrovactinospora gilvigrisea]